METEYGKVNTQTGWVEALDPPDTLEDELTLLYAAIARERARLKYEEAKNEFEAVITEAEAALGSDAAAAIIREGIARGYKAWAERERDDE